MNPTTQQHKLGQSLWLDNITRDLLVSGTLQRYVRDFEVSGLTSNPTIFEHAIRNTHLYDDAIRAASAHGRSGGALFFELALEDLTAAADLFRPIYDATAGIALRGPRPTDAEAIDSLAEPALDLRLSCVLRLPHRAGDPVPVKAALVLSQ